MNHKMIYASPRLTLKELAEDLDVTTVAIYRAMYRNKINTFVSQNIIYITIDEVNRIKRENVINNIKKS